MGACAGHTVSHCAAFTDCCGFDNAAHAVVKLNGVEEWAAFDLLKERLLKQEELYKASPLQYVHVKQGLNIFSNAGSFCSGSLSKANFVRESWNIAKDLHQQGVGGEADKGVLARVFESIDYDEDETLSRGEWAEGLTKFFKGTAEEKIKATFECLDADGNGNLSQTELKEYLTPLVKAMTPPEASSMRPLLIQRVAAEAFDECDSHHQGYITSDEFLEWMNKQGSVEKRVGDIIEREVYKIIDRARNDAY